MSSIYTILLFSFFSIVAKAQNINDIINIDEVSRIERTLSDDTMMGRKVFTPEIEKAAAFISNEMTKIGLQPFDNNEGYYQLFTHKGKKLINVIGVLPGKTKSSEQVIFSAHYDHIGVKKNEETTTDSIYNGANDDASGVTAILQLAKYYKKINNNERTLIFIAFTAEEIGGFGSAYFSKQINPEKVVAMFNIEMIGTESKWGKNSAYITGYEYSDMVKILQKNLKGTGFNFYPDPYVEEQLFYRSDNATLAKLGVPAHTISTSKMDSEPHYHQLSDTIETLDMQNMTAIIKSIAISAKSIISGKDTPTRVGTTH